MGEDSTELWAEINHWVENGVQKQIYTFAVEKENILNYLHLLTLENKLDMEKFNIYGKVVDSAVEFVLVGDRAIHIIKYSENSYNLNHQVYRGEVVYKEVKIKNTAPTKYEEVKIIVANKELTFTNDKTFKNFEKFVESL